MRRVRYAGVGLVLSIVLVVLGFLLVDDGKSRNEGGSGPASVAADELAAKRVARTPAAMPREGAVVLESRQPARMDELVLYVTHARTGQALAGVEVCSFRAQGWNRTVTRTRRDLGVLSEVPASRRWWSDEDGLVRVPWADGGVGLIARSGNLLGFQLIREGARSERVLAFPLQPTILEVEVLTSERALAHNLELRCDTGAPRHKGAVKRTDAEGHATFLLPQDCGWFSIAVPSFGSDAIWHEASSEAPSEGLTLVLPPSGELVVRLPDGVPGKALQVTPAVHGERISSRERATRRLNGVVEKQGAGQDAVRYPLVPLALELDIVVKARRFVRPLERTVFGPLRPGQILELDLREQEARLTLYVAELFDADGGRLVDDELSVLVEGPGSRHRAQVRTGALGELRLELPQGLVDVSALTLLRGQLPTEREEKAELDLEPYDADAVGELGLGRVQLNGSHVLLAGQIIRADGSPAVECPFLFIEGDVLDREQGVPIRVAGQPQRAKTSEDGTFCLFGWGRTGEITLLVSDSAMEGEPGGPALFSKEATTLISREIPIVRDYRIGRQDVELVLSSDD